MCENVANIWKFRKSTSQNLASESHKILFGFVFILFFGLNYLTPILFFRLKDAAIQVKEWWIYVDNNSLNIFELKKW